MAKGQTRIDTLFAFIALDPEDNTEGVPAFYSQAGPLPMMGADMARVDSIRPLAQQVANQLGIPVKLCRFSVREELEELAPEC